MINVIKSVIFKNSFQLSIFSDIATDIFLVPMMRQIAQPNIELLAANLRHPSLKTHKFQSLSGPDGEEVFEAYVQNRVPGAYRVFFYYGPDRIEHGKRIPVVTVFAITPHP